MFHFICFKGFLTTGGEELHYSFNISRVVKEKIVKVSNCEQSVKFCKDPFLA